ncbi:MAG TPA: hypothetical protein PLG73_04680 [Candidatus Sumerlaeota bacterium]|nr:hypothetical protein [Candidatus Sumerlaeota bacterium]
MPPSSRFSLPFGLVLAVACVLPGVAFALEGFPEPTDPAAPRPEIFRYSLDNPPIETLLVDLDGDGYRDFLTLENGRLNLRNDTGFPFWRDRNPDVDAAAFTRIVTAANLDHQGYGEIVAETTEDVWIIDGYSMAARARVAQARVLGLTDLNEDGIAEIYIASREADDPAFPPLSVFSLTADGWTELWSSPGCRPESKDGQDAYQIHSLPEQLHQFDLDEDGQPEILLRLPAGGGWIGVGFDGQGRFDEKWEFTAIQDGNSRFTFLDWTDGNRDTYADIIGYLVDKRRLMNMDIVSLGDPLMTIPLRQLEEPAVSAAGLRRDRVKAGEWPLAQRDHRLSGRSPVKMAIAGAPRESWSYSLGHTPGGLQALELDGRPGADLLVVARNRLTAYSADGDRLWASDQLGGVVLKGVYDLNADGRNELFIQFRPVLAQPTLALLDAATGEVLWKLTTQNYVGSFPRVRIGHFLPDRPGAQLLATGTWGDQEVFFFDFSDGFQAAAQPRWHRILHHVIYPTEDFYDYDGDGAFEFVQVEHSRLRIYDLATGETERDLEWDRHRSYGQMLPLNIDADPYFELLITGDGSVQQVEMIDLDTTATTLRWKVPGKLGHRRYGPGDLIRLKFEPQRVGDVDGDGELEVVYLKYNETGDQKWHFYQRAATDGRIERDEILSTDSFAEAGVGEPAAPLAAPDRPRMVESLAPPLALIEVVDAASNTIRLTQPDGTRAEFAVAEAQLGPTRMLANPVPGGAPMHDARPTNFRPRVADIDGDGRPEILLATEVTTRTLILTAGDRPGAPPADLREDTSGQLLLVYDYDRDGTNERLYLLPHPTGSRMRLLDARDQTLWETVFTGAPQTVNQYTYGDFTGDGIEDICLTFNEYALRPEADYPIFTINNEYARIATWNGANGQFMWFGSIIADERFYGYGGYPVVYDFNGDGCDDIISNTPEVRVINSGIDGKLLYDYRYDKSFWYCWGAYSIPYLDDFDGDGRLDLFSQGSNYGVALATLPDRPLWLDELADQGLYGNLVDSRFQGVADVDGDGHLEIGVGVCQGEFRCYDGADGTIQWRVPMASPTTEVCTADVDGDGLYEFIFGTEAGELYALGGPAGTEDPIKWRVELGAPLSPPTVADVDGDGLGEILVISGDGLLRCFE